MNLREWGDGPRSALLIHGVSSDSAGWAPFAERLIERAWRVVALDLRGHGESPRGSAALPELAGDVVDSVSPGFDLALGHSLGGAVLTLASERLSLRAAVYADPAWKIEMSPALVAAGRNAVATFTREQYQAHFPRLGDHELDLMLEGIGRWDVEAFSAAVLAGPAPDLRPTARPRVPSLVMLSAGVPAPDLPEGYDLVRLESVSHFMFWEDPELCAGTVDDWFARSVSG